MSALEVVQGEKVFRKDLYFSEVGYHPHDGQSLIHYDSHRHRVLCNGRRWGKTFLGGREAEVQAFVRNRLGEPMWGWIVGPEFRDCEKEFRVVYNSLKALGVDLVSDKFLNNVDNGNMVIKTQWGFHLECRSAKHPETLVGEGLDFVLMVEAGRHKRRTWTEYIRPSLSDKRGWSLHSGVPEGATQTSLLYALWQRGQKWRQGGPWKSWRMPSWTNNIVFPGGRNDPEILEAEEDLTKEEFDRQYGAKFVDRVGRVMADWDDEVHLGDLGYNPDWPLYIGLDYGYTNPFVILWIQVDHFNNVYVIREDRHQFKDTEIIAKETMENPATAALLRKVVAMYPDPAEPDDTETLKRHWRIPARTNTGGTIKERIKLIWKQLKTRPTELHLPESEQRPGLLIDRTKCTELAWEMREGYRWPEHQSEVKNDDENPMDKNNHGVEALGRFHKGYFSVVQSDRRSRQSRAKVKR